eukprot:m51a1_g9626 hypothetical protein (212) ;mRNA; f:1123052-1124291
MLTADPEMLITFEAAGGVVDYGVIERSTPALSPLRSYADFKVALKNARDLVGAIANRLQPGFWKNLATKTANMLTEIYDSDVLAMWAWKLGAIVIQVVKQIFLELGAKDLAAILSFQWAIWGIRSLALILLAIYSGGTSEVARIMMVLLDVPELIADIMACIKQWRSYNSAQDTVSHVFGASNAQPGFVYIVLAANPRLVLDVKGKMLQVS